jgi:AcrR family transcriptional regulator
MRERVRQTVSDAILDAAEEVAAERGIPQAGMAMIAGRAGVAVGTVYNHFEDRDNLIRALFRARRAVISPAITAIGEAHREGPFEPRLHGFFADILALLEQHRRFVRLALEAEHLKAEQASRSGRPVMGALGGAAREILVAGAAEGVLAIDDVDRLVRLLLGAMRGLLLHRLDAGGAFTEDADLLVQVFLRGAARPRRRA